MNFIPTKLQNIIKLKFSGSFNDSLRKKLKKLVCFSNSSILQPISILHFNDERNNLNKISLIEIMKKIPTKFIIANDGNIIIITNQNMKQFIFFFTNLLLRSFSE